MRRCSYCAWHKPWSRSVVDSGPQDEQDMETRGEKERERKRGRESGQEKDTKRKKIRAVRQQESSRVEERRGDGDSGGE